MKGKTHYEDGKYYAVIMLPNGHEFYSGAFDTYAKAYYYSVKKTSFHKKHGVY